MSKYILQNIVDNISAEVYRFSYHYNSRNFHSNLRNFMLNFANHNIFNREIFSHLYRKFFIRKYNEKPIIPSDNFCYDTYYKKYSNILCKDIAKVIDEVFKKKEKYKGYKY